MFVKAQRIDSETIIYLDRYDNKWVAQGNSQPWRTNNPGLLHKRDLTDQSKIISHDHLVAIFASIHFGIEAFRHWLALHAYKTVFFLRIAKRYQPASPEIFIDQLYALAFIPSNRDSLRLLPGEFQRFFSAILKLLKFSEHANKPFSLLPKVIGRFYSKERESIHLYLTNNDQLLSKSDAISWIETHRLDAGIVSKGNGNVYLRSRPGRHCGQIRFAEQQFVKDLEFDNLIRDVGTVRERQCIWGFINGIWNDDDGALKSTENISKMTGGEQVWSLKNNFTLFANGTLWQCGQQKMGVDTQVVRTAAKFFQLLITLSHHHATPSPVIIFLHSQGAIIGDLALEHLCLSERQQLRLFTFGVGSLIAPGRAHPDSHNYISIADLIPKIGSSTARIAFRVCLGRQSKG